ILLLAGTRSNPSAARACESARPRAHHPLDDPVVQAVSRRRRRASPRERRAPAEVPARSPPWNAAREPVRVLPALCRRDAEEALVLLDGLPALEDIRRSAAELTGAVGLYRSC